MTNSSPQEPQDPQNPLPERRRRAAAGVTFDEMIAIVVAFSTIGAILFWSLGGKNSKFASNFGFGQNNNNLLADGDTLDILTSPDRQLTFDDRELETEKLAIAKNPSELESNNILTPSSPEFDTTEKLPRDSYQFDTTRRIAPIAGITAGSGLAGFTGRNTQPTPETVNSPNTDAGTVGQDTEDMPSDTAIGGDTGDTTPDTATGDAGNIPPDSKSNPDEIAEMPDDIEPSYWAYPFVKQMSEQVGIAEFADDENFEPDKLITRASMATLISQAFPMQPETQQIKKFKDVTNQNAIAADVDQAVRIGFMQGYSDNEFRPLENIPRYQVLVTLASGLDLKPTQDPEAILQQYGDGTDIPDWAKQQVAAAIEAGLAVNRPDFESNALNPNQSATRAEVAAMIHQALVQTGKLEPIESEYLLKP